MSGNKCCYYGCSKSKRHCQDVSFHGFPTKNAVLCREWIIRAGNVTLETLSPKSLKRKHLCSDHFEDDMYMNSLKKSLKPYAIPKRNIHFPQNNMENITSKGEEGEEIVVDVDLPDFEIKEELEDYNPIGPSTNTVDVNRPNSSYDDDWPSQPSSSSTLTPTINNIKATSDARSRARKSTSSDDTMNNDSREQTNKVVLGIIYKCLICQKLFPSHPSLIKHQKQSHPNQTNTNANTLQASNIQQNINEEKPFKCATCQKCFQYSSNLKVHERVHTGEKPYKCLVCSKTFTKSTNLKNHERTHTGEKPYKCLVCFKTFTVLSNLKDHERIHTGKRPYKCAVCSKRFSKSSELKDHERTHTGERPYKCSVCSKTFVQSSHLKGHERIHTGEKPHKCLVCSKTFALSTNLKVHERVHTGERRFQCAVCSKAYMHSSSLKDHERTHTD